MHKESYCSATWEQRHVHVVPDKLTQEAKTLFCF